MRELASREISPRTLTENETELEWKWMRKWQRQWQPSDRGANESWQGAVHLVITLSEQGHMGGRGQLLPNAKRVGYTKRNQDGSDLNTVRC